jgi:hypothetical protein
MKNYAGDIVQTHDQNSWGIHYQQLNIKQEFLRWHRANKSPRLFSETFPKQDAQTGVGGDSVEKSMYVSSGFKHNSHNERVLLRGSTSRRHMRNNYQQAKLSLHL